MIQDVSRKIHQALVEKLESGEPISKQAIDSSDIPSPIRSYLLATLESEAERVAAVINNQRDVWIAESVDVRRARTAFAVAVTRNVQFPPDRLSDTLRQASDVVLRYLIRPSATLQGTIFERAEPSLDVEEILERMRMFAAYPYFQEVLRHYFAERNIEHVERARLDSVLHRIDRQMTSDFTPDEWLDMLTPLYETLAVTPDFEDGVPADLLRAFFREKELGAILLRLETFAPTHLIDVDELRELLEEKATTAEPTLFDNPQDTEEAHRSSEHSSLSDPEPVAEPVGGMVPLWKQFQRTPERSSPNPTNPSPAPGPVVPMWQRFRRDGLATPSDEVTGRDFGRTNARRSTAEPLPEPDRSFETKNPSGSDRLDVKELERRVLGSRGARSRRMFVQKLFKGSEEDYRSALARIDAAPTWTEASQIIARDVFRRHEINIYDDAAVGFTDMVEARFKDTDRRK